MRFEATKPKGYSFKKAVIALFSAGTAYDHKLITRQEYMATVTVKKNVPKYGDMKKNKRNRYYKVQNKTY